VAMGTVGFRARPGREQGGRKSTPEGLVLPGECTVEREGRSVVLVLEQGGAAERQAAARSSAARLSAAPRLAVSASAARTRAGAPVLVVPYRGAPELQREHSDKGTSCNKGRRLTAKFSI
jgi:hypothetical protein